MQTVVYHFVIIDDKECLVLLSRALPLVQTPKLAIFTNNATLNVSF